MQECLLLQFVPGVLGFLAALGVALQRVRAAEGSEDSLSLRSSVAERAESVLLALSTASRRRASFFMVRLIPVHIRFVPFSVEVLFPSAARFRGLEREGGRSRPPWRKRRPLVLMPEFLRGMLGALFVAGVGGRCGVVVLRGGAVDGHGNTITP